MTVHELLQLRNDVNICVFLHASPFSQLHVVRFGFDRGLQMCIRDRPYEEWFITDYECPIYGVQKMLGEYESLDKLNYLAALIDELSLSDQEKLVAIMEAGCDEVSDIDDLINLTFNLDCYDIMPDINSESDLGYYYAHEAGIYSEKDLGPLANYIDYELSLIHI